MPHGANDPYLDLVFVLDCTGSMGPYIKQATEKIEEISRRLFASKLLNDSEDLRVGVVSYRDYPPQEREYIVKKPRLNFTSNLADIKTYLSQLVATGGGDGPEAVATALHDAAENMSWKPNAANVIVLITDAPPHGIPQKGISDTFPQGDPTKDPTGTKATFSPPDIIKYFTSGGGKGIHILTVQCEPTLTNSYPLGLAFYKGLSKVTNGRMIPLGNAEVLADSIVIFALETLKLRNLINGQGGSKLSAQSPRLHTLLRAVTGIHPSDAEVEKQLQALYEDPTDDLAEQIDQVTATKTPAEAISAVRAHFGAEKCYKCDTNVRNNFSAEGLHNVDLYMKSHSGSLPGSLKEDHGTHLVGDLAKQSINIKEAPLSDGQIKRLSHMYTTRFATGAH